MTLYVISTISQTQATSLIKKAFHTSQPAGDYKSSIRQ